MKIIPSEFYTYQIDASIETIQICFSRLGAKVTGTNFKFDSSIPKYCLIQGSFKDLGDKRLIYIKAEFTWYRKAFYVVWIFFTSSSTIISLVLDIINHRFDWIPLACFGFLIGGAVFMTVLYLSDAVPLLNSIQNTLKRYKGYKKIHNK